MDSRKIFHEIFIKKNYPDYIKEDYIFSLFESCVYELSPRIEEQFEESIPNPHVLLSYIVEEYAYLIKPLSEENRLKLLNDAELKKRLIKSISEKVFFNEYAAYKAKSLISKYNPLISSLRFYINFVLERIVNINVEDESDVLLIDMLRKAFLSCLGVTSLLVEGFETEAFSTWRTIHETECIIKIIDENREVINAYKHHIDYNRAFRDEYDDKDYQQSLIDEIKIQLKNHNLKSKDLKKYIEYGWLYSIKNVNEKYPLLKLNFRNGIEYVANLTNYSSLYEMSSEIAHASPILIYSNKPFFLKITLICLYESFLRIESIFAKIIANKKDTLGYFAMRASILNELEIMLAKEKLEFKHLGSKNRR